MCEYFIRYGPSFFFCGSFFYLQGCDPSFFFAAVFFIRKGGVKKSDTCFFLIGPIQSVGIYILDTGNAYVVLTGMWKTRVNLGETPNAFIVSRKFRDNENQRQRRLVKQQREEDMRELNGVVEEFHNLSSKYSVLTKEAEKYIVKYIQSKMPAMRRIRGIVKLQKFSTLMLNMQMEMIQMHNHIPLSPVHDFFRTEFIKAYQQVVQEYDPNPHPHQKKTPSDT